LGAGAGIAHGLHKQFVIGAAALDLVVVHEPATVMPSTRTVGASMP
jgi:hypothetical protein